MKAAAPVVCIHGDEAFLVDRALAEVEDEALAGGDRELNLQVFEAATARPAEVLNAARTVPFLAARRLVVLRGAERWSADDWREVLAYLEAPSPGTCLVFVANQLDRRLAASKAILRTARVVECRRPKERELPGWAQRLARDAGLKLDGRTVESILLRVGPDLQLLYQEIQKLRVHAGEDGAVTLEDVEALVGETRGTTVFAFCDALGGREAALAYRSLHKLLQLGEPPVRLLFMIVRHFRHLCLAREFLDRSRRPDAKEAASAMGVPPFAAENALRQAKGWGEEELRVVFGRLLEADLALKTGGGVEVLEELVLRIAARGNETRPGFRRGARSSGAGDVTP